MRYALIIAGGSGTRLWPMSRAKLPKQLVPIINDRSLLQIAMQRLDGLIPRERRYICAGRAHREVILSSLPGFEAAQYLGEPQGRDTLNAVGWGAVEIARENPDALIAVLTADHVIEPVGEFQRAVEQGFKIAETVPDVLMTFGVRPTHPATGYGYLKLGSALGGGPVRLLQEFKEKPVAATAQGYWDAGPEQYLWNSGMFVWRASTLLKAIERFAPENHAGLMRIAGAGPPPERDAVVTREYPKLKKISVDYAVMEPASRDPGFKVAAVPMPVSWLDVGSWPAVAKTCGYDAQKNALHAAKHVLLDTRRTLVASSDPGHLIAVLGCDDLMVVHTSDATLVCRADRSEDVKKIHAMVAEQYGDAML
jgi:mannose-1-phosphate guanylyltransferase